MTKELLKKLVERLRKRAAEYTKMIARASYDDVQTMVDVECALNEVADVLEEVLFEETR